MAQSVFCISQTAFDAVKSSENEWQAMFNREETDRVVDMHSFHGGIDHTEVTAKKIIFHDRGCNGKYRDLVILRSTQLVGPEQYPVHIR